MTKFEAKRITKLCIELLQVDQEWSKNSELEEKCTIDGAPFTLGCALNLMQISVVGEANSRSLVMNRVRSKIRRYFFWRQGWHTIPSFNNHKKTKHDDILYLLNKVYHSF